MKGFLPISVHTLVKNEERWVWFALKSWEKYGQRFLVVDDSSTDRTGEVVASLKNKRLDYYRLDSTKNFFGLTGIRNWMIEQTGTEWFVLVDGDEVWNYKTIERFLRHIEKVPSAVVGVFLQTRNCVGDVWHYLSSDSGRYELAGRVGHLNIRAYRRKNGYHWYGEYPLEYYGRRNKAINQSPEQLSYFDGFYWHLTHLTRTSDRGVVAGFRRRVWERGRGVLRSELPEVFWESRPAVVPDPLVRASLPTVVKGYLQTPIKWLKRRIRF